MEYYHAKICGLWGRFLLSQIFKMKKVFLSMSRCLLLLEESLV